MTMTIDLLPCAISFIGYISPPQKKKNPVYFSGTIWTLHGRLIYDAIGSAQEALDQRALCLDTKMDLVKEFDRLNWSFLRPLSS